MKYKFFYAGFAMMFLLAGCNSAPAGNNAMTTGNNNTAEEKAVLTEATVPLTEDTAEEAGTFESSVEAATEMLREADQQPAAIKSENAVAAPKIEERGIEPSTVETSEVNAAGEESGGLYAPLAKCLTKKGVRMYGAYWCPHCADQKAMFGDDFHFVNYFECDPQGENSQAARCTQDKVVSYPTWYFPAGGYDPGTKPLEKVATLAGCESYLPKSN